MINFNTIFENKVHVMCSKGWTRLGPICRLTKHLINMVYVDVHVVRLW